MRHRRVLSRWSRALVVFAVLCPAIIVPAAPPDGVYDTVNSTVNVDGVALGEEGIGIEGLSAYTVAYADGQYHLWYLHDDSGWRSLDKVGYATSVDGINFTRENTLNPPADWWQQTFYGESAATAPPLTNYIRVSRQGNDWMLTIWHPHWAPQGVYNYNSSVWRIGPDIGNPDIELVGPLPQGASNPRGPGGHHVGNSGLVDGYIYLIEQKSSNGLGRFALVGGAQTNPAQSVNNVANLYPGDSGACDSADPDCATRAEAYVKNEGRTLAQEGTLGTYYSLRRDSAGTPPWAKQLYYVESSDNGQSWGMPQEIFADGNAVTIDGLPGTTRGFSGPEVVALGGGAYRGYFNTENICGELVVVTRATADARSGLEVTKAFSPDVVDAGGLSELTVTLQAPSATCQPAPAGPVYTNVSYTDHLPDGLEFDAVVDNSCGGTLTANPGDDAFAITGVDLAPGQSCQTTVAIRVTRDGVFNNILYASANGGPGGITTHQGVSALSDASARLRTTAAVVAVPALGWWMMMLMGLLLAAVGIQRLSRRS